jgi:hypothetical protein
VFALSAFSMTVDKNIAQCDAAFAHFLRMCADEVVLASQTANCIRPIQSCNPCLRSFEFRVRQRRLSIDSVRFMQNHDTIVPPGPFCGKSYVQVRSLYGANGSAFICSAFVAVEVIGAEPPACGPDRDIDTGGMTVIRDP